MRTIKELNDYEFIASNNIKRAMLSLFDGEHNDVEKYLGEALSCMYKLNRWNMLVLNNFLLVARYTEKLLVYKGFSRPAFF